MPEKRKNKEVFITPENSKKQKFRESQPDFKEAATSKVEPEVEDENDDSDDALDEEEEENFDEEDEEDSDEEEEDEDFDGIDDCCKEQFRRFEAGEELEEDEADELEECCAETLEGLNRYGSQYFKILRFRNLYGDDSDDEPPPMPPPKQKLLMEKPKCFEVLGIPDSSTEDQIKRAYLKLARKWHPDKNPNQSDEDAAKFKEILEAYEILMGLRQEEPQPGA